MAWYHSYYWNPTFSHTRSVSSLILLVFPQVIRKFWVMIQGKKERNGHNLINKRSTSKITIKYVINRLLHGFCHIIFFVEKNGYLYWRLQVKSFINCDATAFRKTKEISDDNQLWPCVWKIVKFCWYFLKYPLISLNLNSNNLTIFISIKYCLKDIKYIKHR